MTDKKVAIIYETDNYDKFKIIDGNRPIEHAKKIIESIKEIGMLWQPVLVNERFEIIDGQGRYLASKTLGRKILYVVQPGLTIKHARCLNENSTIWKIKDYIHSYAVGSDSKAEFTNFEAVQNIRSVTAPDKRFVASWGVVCNFKGALPVVFVCVVVRHSFHLTV